MLPAKSPSTSRARGAASWTWLVAETAGFSAMSVVHVRVLSACSVPEGSRLVVHEVRADGYSNERPLASLQRVLTRDALSRGLDLRLFRPHASPEGGTRIEAWIDTCGDEELDFDGVQAQPHGASLVGRANVQRERATLVLEPVLPNQRPAARSVRPAA